MPTVNQIRSAKKKMKPVKSAATKIQRAWRTKKVRNAGAATKIQSAWRTKKVRNTGNNLQRLLNKNKACAPKNHLHKIKKLSEGVYGKVFKASLNRNGRRFIAYKNIAVKNGDYTGMAKYEYEVAKKLKSYGVKVPNVYLAKKCDGRDMLYMEYISGQTFSDWIRDMPVLEKVKSVILQVMLYLYKMHKLEPGFRHHDLHGGNIFIRKVPVKDIRVNIDGEVYKRSNEGLEPVIIDFGMTKMPGISNPWINNGTYVENGINGKRSHPLFDLYYFLVGVVFDTTTGYIKVQEFIKDLIPDQEYRKQNSNYAVNYRLKIGMNHTRHLPSFKKVLRHSFLSTQKPAPFRPRIRTMTPTTPRNSWQSPAPPRSGSKTKTRPPTNVMRKLRFK